MALKRTSLQTLRRNDAIFQWLTFLAAWFGVVLLAWITIQVLIKALPAIHEFGFGFLFSTDWNPVTSQYGAAAAIFGTLVSSILALLVATPLGVAISIFLSEGFLPPKVEEFFKFLVEMLAAIPSVIYGLWGIFVVIPITRELGMWLFTNFNWIPLFSTPPFGPGMLPAALVLGIMVLPTIAALSRTALVTVPPAMKAGAQALGATRWEVLMHVTLPYAATGIFGAVVLALGRAMGETMALAMLVGNSNQISFSVLAPANTIAAMLANNFGEASGMQVASLMYLSFILMVITLAINMFAELAIFGRKKGAKK